MDKLGLDQNDRNILLTIIEKFSGGPVGLDTLAAALGEDAGTLEDVYEPYLLMNGLLTGRPGAVWPRRPPTGIWELSCRSRRRKRTYAGVVTWAFVCYNEDTGERRWIRKIMHRF